MPSARHRLPDGSLPDCLADGIWLMAVCQTASGRHNVWQTQCLADSVWQTDAVCRTPQCQVPSPTWQEQGFWKFLLIDHFGEFLGKFACPDLSFLSIFQHILPQTFNLQKMPKFTLRGLCTFTVHPTWQEQGFWKFLSIHHFGEFLEKFACPDLSFLSIFQHFLPQTFNLQKCQYSRYGAFVPSLCIPHCRNKVSEKFCRSNILVNFWIKFNLHVRTLDYFWYFSTFFLKLFISK